MRSSRSDEILGELADGYDRAYEALGRGDLSSVRILVDAAERLLDELRALAGAESGAGKQEALEALGRLQASMSRVKQETAEELARVRFGRRVLEGYSRPGSRPGPSIESRC
ncbi:MAG: hypothetical protein Fur0037_01290 [Planctomycetota bacterium]